MICIIPARAGSVGVKDKNVKLFNGKPLITYTIETAIKSKCFEKIFVYTDSDKIREIAKDYNVNTEYIEGSDIADGSLNVFPFVLRDLINKIEGKEETLDIKNICIMLPTAPLRKTNTVRRATALYYSRECDWVTTVSPTGRHPYRTRYIDEQTHELFPVVEGKDIWRQRQDLPDTYEFNGSVYVTSRDVLMSKEIWKRKWLGIVVPIEEGIDIDSEIDFKLAELILQERGK